MLALLGTHAFLWGALTPEKLSERAREAIVAPENVLLISFATVWELSIKVGSGKRVLDRTPKESVNYHASRLGVRFLPLALRHLDPLATLPLHHRDPFDRLPVAQAMVENIPLVSADAAFRPYEDSGLDLIW